MLAVEFDDSTARSFLERLEKREALRSGVPRASARARLAGQLGEAPGTLENLSRGRLKGIRHKLFEKLRTAVLRQLHQEISAHQHELEIVHRLGRGIDPAEMAAIETGLSTLRRLLKQAV